MRQLQRLEGGGVHIDEGLVLLVLEVFPQGGHYGVLTGWGMAVEE